MVTTEKPERNQKHARLLQFSTQTVTLFLSHCTSQSKSQHQPNLEWAETTKLSGKGYGYVEAIKLIENINAFNLTRVKEKTFIERAKKGR